MNLSDVINKDLILFPLSTLKTAVLDEMVDWLFNKKIIENPQNIKDQILTRESLMSTGIGLGIGIPHVRTIEIKNPIIAVGISKNGISNYSSIDNETVKLIFMILVNKTEHKEYIQLLSQIVKKMKDEKIRSSLIESENSINAYNILMC